MKIQQCIDLKNRNILEIGCGDGRITQLLAKRANKVVAIDPGAKSLDKARNRIPGVDFRVGSGEQLEIKNDSFDVVLFTHSLHHQDSGRALQEAHRVLKESGRVIVLEPTIDGELDQLCMLFVNETQQMIRAWEAINASALIIEHRETFEIDWEFENKEDLYSWICEYYCRMVDETIVTQINHVLGEKIDMSPLPVKDKVLLVCLKTKNTAH
jgi:ubiquinone/menaquinone biosynthesis C-methylase UbiE